MSAPYVRAGRGGAIAPGAEGLQFTAGMPAAPGRAAAPRQARLRTRFAQRRLGEVMALLGLLSPKSIVRALEYQAEHGLLFGQCCRRLELVAESGLQQALACQFGFLHALAAGESTSPALVMRHSPFAAYGEAVRAIRGRLGARVTASGRKVLAVASAGAREGRSHVAANLAVAFAQAGWRTLLIDADLRAPTQHAIFGVPQHPGLSRLLCGYTHDGIRHEPGGLTNLSLITAGPSAPNPSELLAREELAALLRQCRDHHDIVLLDTPCSGRFVDAELVAAAAGGALVIAAEGRSGQEDVRSLLGRLDGAGVQVLGTLMNAC